MRLWIWVQIRLLSYEGCKYHTRIYVHGKYTRSTLHTYITDTIHTYIRPHMQQTHIYVHGKCPRSTLHTYTTDTIHTYIHRHTHTHTHTANAHICAWEMPPQHIAYVHHRHNTHTHTHTHTHIQQTLERANWGRVFKHIGVRTQHLRGVS